MQTANADKVDVVSGATYSSNGIMEAVRDALKKAVAKKNNNSSNNNKNNSTSSDKDNNSTTEKPTPTVPVTKEDKVYEGTAKCEPDEDGDFDAYDMSLEVVVSGDKEVKGIQNIKWSDKSMKSWYSMAEKGMVPQLVASGFDVSTKYDTVSGATCSSNALIAAYKNAIEQVK